MASNAMNTTALANWIPEYQSAKALSALEKALVIQKCVWTDWRQYLKFGDTLNVPIVPNLGTADAVNLLSDLTLNAQVAGVKQIVVNQWNYKAVGVGYREQMQNYPDYLTSVTEKCTYSVALAIDTYLAALFVSLTAGNVDCAADNLSDDDLIAMKQYLDIANAPFEDRYLALDVESIGDMLKLDKVLRDDYVARGSVEQGGFVGRSIYGCKVVQSNNLKEHDTDYHWGAMFQKEAIGLIIQKSPSVRYFDWEEKHTNVVESGCIFGAGVLRPTCGSLLNTRS